MYRDNGTTYTTMRELRHIVPAKSVTACDLSTLSVMSFCFRSVTAYASTASSELYDLKCQFSERSKAKGAILKFQKYESVSGDKAAPCVCTYVLKFCTQVCMDARRYVCVCVHALLFPSSIRVPWFVLASKRILPLSDNAAALS